MSERKVAVVTGASRGIGREIAIQLAEWNYDVVINYSGNKEKAEEVAEKVKNRGGDALLIKADVSNTEEVENMFKQTVEHFGRIDALINNAGITRDNLMMRMKEQDWDDVLDINLKGVFLCSQKASRTMMKQKSGVIINISSVVGLTGNAGQSNYVAAKSGVIGLTKSMAKEFSSRGIRVNAVAPGFIETDMTDKLNDEIKSELLKQIPLGYLGSTKDIADTVVFLVSDQARYITGQVISVDGGMHM